MTPTITIMNPPPVVLPPLPGPGDVELEWVAVTVKRRPAPKPAIPQGNIAKQKRRHSR